ncbi:MAG: NADH-quinone oxidoreductase subunit N [Candidatus Binatia bacterium]
MNLGNLESLTYSYAEGVLALGVVALFMLELVVKRKPLLGEVALVITAAACCLGAVLAGGPQGLLFNGMVALDSFAIFFKLLLGLAAFGAVWLSLGSDELEGEHPGEYFGLLLACTLGMFYMASATNMLMAYLALEFVSQTSYILTGFIRGSRRAGEAALKYLIYGGVASGAMIYGMSLVYGLAGSLDYNAISQALVATEGNAPILFIALVLVLAGFGYKIAMVPFHMWSPDVYHGAPLPVAAFLAVGSKAAGFAILIRFFYVALSSPLGDGNWALLEGVDWPGLVVVASMVTMTLGNLAALRQDNVKRLLAYSSIAHAGYILMGFVVLTDDGLRAMLFYMVVYYLMNLGAFAVLLTVLNGSGREDMQGFRGLAWRGGALPAAAMMVFLFSLAGLPPFAGFIGKFYLFAAIIAKEMWLYAVVGALNSVVSLYYYARIVRTMYLDQPTEDDPVVRVDLHSGVLIGVLAVLTLVFGVYWRPVIALADRSLVLFGG